MLRRKLPILLVRYPLEIFEIQNELITNKTYTDIAVELRYSYTSDLDYRTANIVPGMTDIATETRTNFLSKDVPARSAVTIHGGTGGWDYDFSEPRYSNVVWKVIYK